VIVVAVIWCVFTHSCSDFSLNDGTQIHVTRASLWDARRGSSCKVKFKTVQGTDGAIVFGQDLFAGPLLIIPASGGTNLLCLYDDDIDLRLIRINTRMPYSQSMQATSGGVGRMYIPPLVRLSGAVPKIGGKPCSI